MEDHIPVFCAKEIQLKGLQRPVHVEKNGAARADRASGAASLRRRWRILSFLGGEMGGSAKEERGHHQAASTSEEVVGRCQQERPGLGASSHTPYSLKGRTQSNMAGPAQVSLRPS